MVVITGASDGLGLELAKLYAESGATVVSVSRRQSAAATYSLQHDLSFGEEVVAAANKILAFDEPLEVLINCAGVMTSERLGGISDAEIKRLMAINVEAPLLLVSELFDRIKNDGTDIVNIASMVGMRPRLHQTLYSTSKAAVRGLSASLQLELSAYPSRVMSVCPGSFESNIFKKAAGEEAESTKSGSLMSPAALAGMIKYLIDLPKNIEITEILVNRKKVDGEGS